MINNEIVITAKRSFSSPTSVGDKREENLYQTFSDAGKDPHPRHKIV